MADENLNGKRLKALKESGGKATIYMVNGIRLVGTVLDYDDETVVLSGLHAGGMDVTRRNISTVVSAEDDNGKSGGLRKKT